MPDINERKERMLERISLLSTEKQTALERLNTVLRDMGEFVELLDSVRQLLPTSLRERINQYRS